MRWGESYLLWLDDVNVFWGEFGKIGMDDVNIFNVVTIGLGCEGGL